MKTNYIALASGLVWGLIAALIFSARSTWGHIHDVRWWACALAPLVGLGIYHCSRWSYRKSLGIQFAWALVTLYLASGVYGLIIGCITWAMLSGANLGAVIEPALAFWGGLTFFGYIIVLGPLAIVNHQLLRRYEPAAR